MKEIIRYAWGSSTLGEFIVANSERGLVALEFGERSGPLLRELQARLADAELIEDPIALQDTVLRAAALIEHPESGSTLAADLRGSDFERRVWQALQDIPAGTTTSYGELAARLGVPGQAQEVGAACAANTLAVLVPCHRVLKKDGGISGYRWGVRRKRALIEREHLAGFRLR
jgi:AraC family transcriptional regulator, regulatory protein of adaptative response / methylated-DNA-[protein]-cysteine methyltransferase